MSNYKKDVVDQQYPMRINKYLAVQGISSRREADHLIVEGKVRINGVQAKLGDKVCEGDDIQVSRDTRKLVYVAFNKPRGVITHSPQQGEKSIQDMLGPSMKHLAPLGRLDKDSHGLILLTNDGRVNGRLLHPSSDHEKEYEVRVDAYLSPRFLVHMSRGVQLEDGYTTKRCVVHKLRRDVFRIILTEGKKHQIRRMCDALGYAVLDLERIVTDPPAPCGYA